MHIAIVTLFPAMIEGFTAHGVLSRAIDRGLLDLSLHNPRDYTVDVHRCVDDRPYGGGPGMVMKAEPLLAAISAARQAAEAAAQADQSAAAERRALTVYLSPQGRCFKQTVAVQWAAEMRPLVLVAGRYEGVDQRVLDSAVDCEISLGDFVLSGGEVGAMAIVDAVSRLLPGALGNDASAQSDSHGRDGLLEHPHYTRPESVDGRSVPEVLLRGDHREIAVWRRRQSLINTLRKRPDLITVARANGSISDAEFEQLNNLSETTDR